MRGKQSASFRGIVTTIGLRHARHLPARAQRAPGIAPAPTSFVRFPAFNELSPEKPPFPWADSDPKRSMLHGFSSNRGRNQAQILISARQSRLARVCTGLWRILRFGIPAASLAISLHQLSNRV